MTTDNNTTRGAEHIGAVRLSEDEWAYYDAGTQRWYPADDRALAELGELLDHERADVRADAYSHWCAGRYCVGPDGDAYPKGWRPARAK
jgi:hypothetical protein